MTEEISRIGCDEVPSEPKMVLKDAVHSLSADDGSTDKLCLLVRLLLWALVFCKVTIFPSLTWYGNRSSLPSPCPVVFFDNLHLHDCIEGDFL